MISNKYAITIVYAMGCRAIGLVVAREIRPIMLRQDILNETVSQTISIFSTLWADAHITFYILMYIARQKEGHKNYIDYID